MLRPDIIPMLKSNGLNHFRVVESKRREGSKLSVYLFLTPPRKRNLVIEPFSHEFWKSRYSDDPVLNEQSRHPSPMVDPTTLIRSDRPLLAKQIGHSTIIGQRVKESVDEYPDVKVFPLPISMTPLQRGFWPTYVTLEAEENTEGESYLRLLIEKLAAEKVPQCTNGSRANLWFQKLHKLEK